MASKYGILRLIAAAIIVSSAALKAAASETEQLFATRVEQYLNITDFALAQSRSIVSQALQGAAIGNASSDDKSTLMFYVKDVSDELQRQPASRSNSAARFLQLVSRLLIFEQFEAVVRKHQAEQPSVVLSALRRHDLEQFERELEQRRAKFLADFFDRVRGRIESWTEAQKQTNAKVLDWYLKYNGTSDTRRINEIINEFAKIA